MSETDDEHSRAEMQFSDLVDGSLSPADRATLQAHLAGCPRCKQALQTFEQTMAAMKSARRETPSPEFMDSLREQIRARSRGRFFGERRRSYRLEIASLVSLAIALAVYVALHLVEPMLRLP